MSWVKIAGRGKLGDINWGADFSTPKKELMKQLEELRKHIGEKVLLSGGGRDYQDIVVLKDAYIELIDKEKKWALKARVSCPERLSWMGKDFTPWLDSWQISVKKEG